MEKGLHSNEEVIPAGDDTKEGSILPAGNDAPPPVWSTKEERLVRLKYDSPF